MPLGQTDSADVSPREDIINPPGSLTRTNERPFLGPSSPSSIPSQLIDRSILPRPSGINPAHADILPSAVNHATSGRTRGNTLLAASSVRSDAVPETQGTESTVAAVARDQVPEPSVSPSNIIDTSFFGPSADPD